jgi:hypothetical protein
MMSDYTAAILAADRTQELIAEADMHRLAKLTRCPKRRTGRVLQRPMQWFRAVWSSPA